MSDFLATVAVDAGRTLRPLGLEPPESLVRWAHIRLFPMTFGQLELLDEPPPGAEGEEPAGDAGDEGAHGSRRRAGPAAASQGTRSAQLWVGLARAALISESSGGTGHEEAPSTDPVVVAKAIDEHDRDVAYDQVVVGYLLQIAQELRSKEGREAVALRKRISKLVGSLKPQTLRRLLDMGGDLAQRRRFVLDATAGMAVDAVVDLVEAAAESSNQTISHSMMRLLSKFAAHAEGGQTATRPQADGALRDNVQRLMSEWNLADPNPDGYRRTLEGLSRLPAMFATAEHSYPPEPERMVQMSLETGAIGEPLWRAVDAMAARPDLGGLPALLDEAPAGWAREAIWSHVASQERLRGLLASSAAPALLERIVQRLGLAAVDPLLDAFEGAGEKDARALGDLLVPLGAEIVPTLLLRLEGARWARQRRLLGLLARLPEIPPGFDALSWISHPDDGVRREGMRVALKLPATREVAITAGLLDADSRVVRGALAAALGGCSPEAAGTIMRRMDEGAYAHELAPLAVRVVAQRDDAAVCAWLVRQVSERGGWRRRPRLRAVTDVTIAAVEGLAARWRGDPDAAAVLALAATSEDPELRAATAPRRASVMLRDTLRAIEEEAQAEPSAPGEPAPDAGDDAAPEPITDPALARQGRGG